MQFSCCWIDWISFCACCMLDDDRLNFYIIFLQMMCVYVCGKEKISLISIIKKLFTSVIVVSKLGTLINKYVFFFWMKKFLSHFNLNGRKKIPNTWHTHNMKNFNILFSLWSWIEEREVMVKCILREKKISHNFHHKMIFAAFLSSGNDNSFIKDEFLMLRSTSPDPHIYKLALNLDYIHRKLCLYIHIY